MKRLLMALAMIAAAVMPIIPLSYKKPAGMPEPVKNEYLTYVDFNVKIDGGFNIGIDSVAICFSDPEYKLSQSDFSGLAITKDGSPVVNAVDLEKAVFDYKVEGKSVKYNAPLEAALNEPGVYQLKGSFKGKPFISERSILEKPGDTPADPEMLEQSQNNMGFYISQDGEHWELKGFSLEFHGRQEAFRLSDLTDLRVTWRSVNRYGMVSMKSSECPADLNSETSRNLSYSYYSSESDTAGLATNFSFTFVTPLSEPGEYFIQGLYQGRRFSNHYQMPDYEFQK